MCLVEFTEAGTRGRAKGGRDQGVEITHARCTTEEIA